MTQYVAAIDQGTTSTRCMIFDHSGRVVAVDQLEHEQIFPKAGWVEHDAAEIWANTRQVCGGALARADIDSTQIAAVGITNQRETTVIWDRATGEPIHHAIVWQDTRTQAICDELGALGGGAERYKAKTGLPLATYFAGPKARWILDNVEGARERAERGELAFGTMDTWVLWNATGGAEGGLHLTDPTNASRTLLMNIDTLEWDPQLCEEIGVPMAILPEIRSSSENYGPVRARGTFRDVPVSGILGDQQAATFGQACLEVGEAKNTYGTGNFVLLNTGTEKVESKNGLLTTVCYKIGDAPQVYALEGSIAVTGSLVQWMRDNLGMIATAAEVETLAKSVEDNGGGLRRPRVLRPVRPVLAGRRPRRHRRADPLREQGPHRPCRAGGHGVPDPRGHRRDERRLRGSAHHPEGRRRHGRQRDSHAVPGRPARGRRRPSHRLRDHRARRRLRGRPRRRLLGVRAGHPGQLGAGQGVVAADGPRGARRDLRAVEEGGHAHLRLGVRGMWA